MFGKKPAAIVEPATGISVLRAALRSRRFKGHLSLLARDLQCGISDLEEFCNGKVPSEKLLQGLAKEFFNAELDVESNRLRPLNKIEPSPLGLIPPRFTPSADLYPPSIDLTIPQPLFSPGKPPGKPYDAKRPGWA